MTKIHAVHFLGEDMTPRNGQEKPWKVGETRTVKGRIELCENGYHYCHDWRAAFKGEFLYGPMACIVEVEDDGPKDQYKGVSQTRTLVEVYNVEREMRLFAADEAEMALKRWEKRNGKPADIRSWAAVKAARDFSDKLISPVELAAAWDAARAAAMDAARDAAWDAARAAARAAAMAAARDAARDAAWAAARDAAWDAARDAAWAAARAAAMDAARDAARDAAAKRFEKRMIDATGWVKA